MCEDTVTEFMLHSSTMWILSSVAANHWWLKPSFYDFWSAYGFVPLCTSCVLPEISLNQWQFAHVDVIVPIENVHQDFSQRVLLRNIITKWQLRVLPKCLWYCHKKCSQQMCGRNMQCCLHLALSHENSSLSVAIADTCHCYFIIHLFGEITSELLTF